MAFTMAGVVRHWAATTPDRPMLTYAGETSTWSEHHHRSNRVAQALLAEGVGPQDRVAFLDKNGPEYFEVAFGGAKISAVLVAVNWRLAPPEMAWIINDAEAKVLVVGPDFAGQLAEFEDQLTTVGKIVVLGGGGAGGAGGDDRHIAYADWLGWAAADDPGIEAAPDDVAMQLYTSGTTGLPKGVMLSNANLGALIPEGSKEMHIDQETVSMVAMPLFHIGGSGWALLGIANGGQTVIIREVDPVAILRAFEEHHVSHAFVVPAVLMLLLASPNCATTDFSSLRYLAYGAAPISEKVLVQALDAFGCFFVQLYGATETTGAITLLRPEEHAPGGAHPERLRSCGKPFSHVELRIVDLDSGGSPVASGSSGSSGSSSSGGASSPGGALSPGGPGSPGGALSPGGPGSPGGALSPGGPGSPGELWTRSAQNMLGYWHNPDATAATITEDGWLRTGDVAYLDADGFVYLHDRVKDMIVSGGENIYPAEVENALMGHGAVADAAVIGVPDDKWGESVKALVVKAPGADVAPEELIEFARARIAHYKAPRSVDFVDSLPRNPSGKLLKRELREPYWKGVERRIH